MDGEIAKTAEADAALSGRMEVLTSIAGVGPAVADAPALGRVDGKAVSSLAGVAPWTRESDQWRASP